MKTKLLICLLVLLLTLNVTTVNALDFDDCVYITDEGTDNLDIIDVSDIENMAHVGNINGSGNNLGGAYDIYVKDEVAYVVALNDMALVAINVSDPTTPTVLDYLYDDGDYIDYPSGITIRNDVAYVIGMAPDNQSISMINITDPEDLTALGKLKIDGGGPDYYYDVPESIIIDGSYAYVGSTNKANFVVFNIADYNNIRNVSDTGSEVEGGKEMKKQGNYVYLTNPYTDGGICIIDVSSPTNPAIISDYEPAPTMYLSAIDVYDTTAYVGGTYYNGSHIFAVYNITGNSPELEFITIDADSPYYIEAQVTDVRLLEENVLLVLTATNLIAFDVTNPYDPTYISQIAYGGDNFFCFGLDYDPIDYNFWFIICGVITFCAVTFYALIITKGRR